MDATENSHNQPPTSTRVPGSLAAKLTLLVVGLQVLIALVTYPFMPEMVPSHWNIVGQIDGYMPRFWNALFMPGLSILLVVMLKVLVRGNPRLGNAENQQTSQRVIDRFLVILVLFLLVMQGTIAAIALGYTINLAYVINSAAGLLFILLGNYLGKVRRNFWLGIRTPWTLASDIVWERTHRLGSWLFVLLGVITLILNFIGPVRRFALLAPLFLVCVILFVYSYLCYQRLEKSGRGPLSPPLH